MSYLPLKATLICFSLYIITFLSVLNTEVLLIYTVRVITYADSFICVKHRNKRYIRHIETKRKRLSHLSEFLKCHKSPQAQPAHSANPSTLEFASPKPPPIGAIAHRSNRRAPLAHSANYCPSKFPPSTSRPGQALQTTYPTS